MVQPGSPVHDAGYSRTFVATRSAQFAGVAAESYVCGDLPDGQGHESRGQMLWRSVQAGFDDSRRGDDRREAREPGRNTDPGAPIAAPPPRKPPIFTRRAVRIVMLLGVLAIVYGTLIPFSVDTGRPLNWTLGFDPPAPGDSTANVMIYIPIGLLLRLIARRRGTSAWREWLISLPLACGLSYLAELAQTVIPLRVATWSDVMCNSIGAAIGIAIAPGFQRFLRNWHGWVYTQLRERPMETAATAAMITICLHALTPLDVHPHIRHIQQRLESLWPLPDGLLWGVSTDGGLPAPAVLDKIIAACSYGLLAVLAFLAAREANRTIGASLRIALLQSAALAFAVEMLQLFTISHALDLRDLLTAWFCCGLGVLGARALAHLRCDLHRRPRTVLKGLLAAVSLVLVVWWIGEARFQNNADATWGPASWLPGSPGFHRSWDGLLGTYLGSLFQYGLISGIMVLWVRSARRAPEPLLILAGMLSVCLIKLGLALLQHRSLDTMQFALAMMGAVSALYFDHVVFRRKPDDPLPATPADGNPSIAAS